MKKGREKWVSLLVFHSFHPNMAHYLFIPTEVENPQTTLNTQRRNLEEKFLDRSTSRDGFVLDENTKKIQRTGLKLSCLFETEVKINQIIQLDCPSHIQFINFTLLDKAINFTLFQFKLSLKVQNLGVSFILL